jgi:chromosome segregation ATPase
MNGFFKTKPTQSEVVPGSERIRDKAIAFGNHIAELEEQLEAAREQIGDLDRRAKLAEAQVEQLREHYERVRREWDDERSRLKAERDRDHDKWTRTLATLRSSASLILDAMKEEPEEKYRPRPSTIRAVEKALATRQALADPEAAAPPPVFLTRRPDAEPESQP